MQIQRHDITGGKRVLRQGRQEEFINDARTGDADPTLGCPGPRDALTRCQIALKWLDLPAQCSRLVRTRGRTSAARAVPHATEELMPLVLSALLDPSVRCKRHESVMNGVIDSVRGCGVRNGSAAMSAHVRAMKDALTPVRLHRANSLPIPWVISLLSS